MTDVAQETSGEVKEPKKKKAKAPKEPKEPKVSRPRLPKFPDEYIITVLRPNAKTGESGKRYNAYRQHMTVKEYVDVMTAEPFNRTVGQVFGDLRWDTDPNRKLVHIGPEPIEPPAPTPPAA
jgi:hypothetical protein